MSQLVTFTPIKTAYDASTSFEENRRIGRAAERAAENTLKLVNEYLSWLKKERHVNAATQKLVVDVLTEVTEFLYRDETDRFKGPPYSDVPVIVLLRKLRQTLKKKAKAEPPAADVSLKWLDWDEFVRFVQQLELECLPYYNSQKTRTLRAIARSVRRYLICALLCYLPPDRQRTLRQLEVGKTLVQGGFRKDGFFQPSDKGQWFIWLGKGDYKTFLENPLFRYWSFVTTLPIAAILKIAIGVFKIWGFKTACDKTVSPSFMIRILCKLSCVRVVGYSADIDQLDLGRSD